MAQARRVKRKPAPAKSPGPTPGWVWLLAGMIVGLSIAAVFYMQGADRMGQDPSWLTERTAPAAPPATSSAAPAPPPAAAAPSGARFQFYEMLPQDEITIPPPAPRATPSTPAPPAQQTARTHDRIVLQAGSFRQFAQADEMKARLALMGLQANIREVRINGETFHRVFLGPFDTETQANRTLDRLRRENIEALRLPASG